MLEVKESQLKHVAEPQRINVINHIAENPLRVYIPPATRR